jgi:CRP-like cAMP-binding protein
MYEAFLKGCPIFSTLTTEEVLTIADALVPLSATAGEVVVRQGDAHADRFYIVEDGELKAEIEGVEGEVCDRLVSGEALFSLLLFVIHSYLRTHACTSMSLSFLPITGACAGSYFGERALITDEPRAATVTAVADSKLLAMDRAAFLRLLGPITDLLARNMEIYAKYTASK